MYQWHFCRQIAFQLLLGLFLFSSHLWLCSLFGVWRLICQRKVLWNRNKCNCLWHHPLLGLHPMDGTPVHKVNGWWRLQGSYMTCWVSPPTPRFSPPGSSKLWRQCMNPKTWIWRHLPPGVFRIVWTDWISPSGSWCPKCASWRPVPVCKQRCLETCRRRSKRVRT